MLEDVPGDDDVREAQRLVLRGEAPHLHRVQRLVETLRRERVVGTKRLLVVAVEREGDLCGEATTERLGDRFSSRRARLEKALCPNRDRRRDRRNRQELLTLGRLSLLRPERVALRSPTPACRGLTRGPGLKPCVFEGYVRPLRPGAVPHLKPKRIELRRATTAQESAEHDARRVLGDRPGDLVGFPTRLGDRPVAHVVKEPSPVARPVNAEPQLGLIAGAAHLCPNGGAEPHLLAAMGGRIYALHRRPEARAARRLPLLHLTVEAGALVRPAVGKAEALVLPRHEVESGRVGRREHAGRARRLLARLVQLHRRGNRRDERVQRRAQLRPAAGVRHLPHAVDGNLLPVGLRRRVAGVEVADVAVQPGEGAQVLNLLVWRRGLVGRRLRSRCRGGNEAISRRVRTGIPVSRKRTEGDHQKREGQADRPEEGFAAGRPGPGALSAHDREDSLSEPRGPGDLERRRRDPVGNRPAGGR